MKNSRHFTWPNVAFLGLDGDAKACLDAYRTKVILTQHATLITCTYPIFTQFHCVASEPDTPVEAQLRLQHAHIKSHFGPATFCYPDYTKSLPSFFWELDDFFLSCSLQYAIRYHCISCVRHYAEHRAEKLAFVHQIAVRDQILSNGTIFGSSASGNMVFTLRPSHTFPFWPRA